MNVLTINLYLNSSGGRVEGEAVDESSDDGFLVIHDGGGDDVLGGVGRAQGAKVYLR